MRARLPAAVGGILGGVGDPEFEAEYRVRRSRRRFVVTTVLLVVALVLSGAWVHSQVPAAVALEPASSVPVPPAGSMDVSAAASTDRLATAAGRTLLSLADQVADPVSNPMESQAPIVSGARAASEKYAETLAELGEAEAAAAEQLALTKDQAAAAEAERDKAAKTMAKEEAAAARQVDAAIDAAILAAQAQSEYVPTLEDFTLGATGPTLPEGSATSTAQVLDLVRKYFPADEVGNAMAVSRCESGHANRVSKPNGNGTRDFGVFQINDGGTIQAALRRIGVSFSDTSDARSKALDPALNVRMARAIWDSRGWQPWVCAAKIKIVAGLYQRTPGPMAGKYDEYGRAL
jgi:hypothetical protein